MFSAFMRLRFSVFPSEETEPSIKWCSEGHKLGAQKVRITNCNKGKQKQLNIWLWMLRSHLHLHLFVEKFHQFAAG